MYTLLAHKKTRIQHIQFHCDSRPLDLLERALLKQTPHHFIQAWSRIQ